MKIDSIEFPTDLIDAIRKDDLVVFAGAGVSMGAPAHLPSFQSLATKIGAGAAAVREQNEPDDRYLGRLAQRGVNVHERACRELSSDTLQPTMLHESLLRLFSGGQSVKLVTTNFDMLFERAASKVGYQLEVFRAPALPRGERPNGLVHLHGAVTRCEDIVLTDVDFGRAYLTEGWARRFLVSLFSRWTVLFIGYSHNDAIVTYLSRALPQDSIKKRYALVGANEPQSHWHLLGIEAVTFPQRQPTDFNSLTGGVERLATFVRRSIVDLHSEIVEISRHRPPVDPEQGDMIADALRSIETARPFFGTATHPEWIEWLDRRGLFGRLFGAGELGAIDGELARWLVAKFVSDEAQLEVLRLFEKHRLCLSPGGWYTIAREVGVTDDLGLSRRAVSRWVTVLLATRPRVGDGTFLVWLAERSHKLGLVTCVVQIFAALLEPTLTLRRGVSGGSSGSDVRVETQPSCDHFGLSEVWGKCLRPDIVPIAQPILECCVRYFEQVTAVDDAWGGGGIEAIAWDRSAVEPHDQDRYPDVVDTIVDAARDCVVSLCGQDAEVGTRWVKRLASSNAKILNRIAIHATAVRADISEDAKILFILDSFGLNPKFPHHEVWRCIRNAYPKAKKSTQRRVLSAIMKHVPAGAENKEVRIAGYRFEWLSWLLRVSPGDQRISSALDRLKRDHPDWQPSEHPDLTVYSSGSDYHGAPSPWTVDQLRHRVVKEVVSDLLLAQPKDAFGVDRHGLVQTVGEVATVDAAWGVALADELIRLHAWDSDLWSGLFRAWTSKGASYSDILVRIETREVRERFVREVADVLFSIAQSEDPGEQVLERANFLAERLWASIPPTVVQAGDEWLQTAINRPAGVIGQFWVHSLSIWRKAHGKEPRPLVGAYLRSLTAIMREDSDNARLARSTVARELAFLVNVDPDWTRRELLPHFDLSHGNRDFQAVWDGFSWGRLTVSAAEVLQDCFFAALTQFDGLLEKQRDRLIDRFTWMVRFFVSDPMGSWIPQFFRSCGSTGRRSFAHDVENYLQGLEEPKQLEWWGRWLKAYWKGRIDGVPDRLEKSEVEIMLGWLPHLTAVFDEAVGLALLSPKLPIDHSLIIYELSKSELAMRYPEAMAALMLHLSDLPMPSYLMNGADRLAGVLLESKELSAKMRRRLMEMLARKGITLKSG